MEESQQSPPFIFFNLVAVIERAAFCITQQSKYMCRKENGPGGGGGGGEGALKIIIQDAKQSIAERSNKY